MDRGGPSSGGLWRLNGSCHAATRKVRPPIWRHYAEIAFWLVPDAVAGTCALFLAPLQFSERLRKRYTTTHHVVGRIYVVGALVLAPLGAYGQYLAEGSGAPREFTTRASSMR